MKMIRYAALLLALALLCGCTPPAAPVEEQGSGTHDAGQKDGTPLFEMSEALAAASARMESDPPVAVRYRFTGVGGMTDTPLYGAEIARQVFDALAGIVVTGKTKTAYTDYDEAYVFVHQDGSEDSVRFNGGNLEADGKYYTLADGAAHPGTAFPTVGRDLSLTDTHPDAAYRGFAEAFSARPAVQLSVCVDGVEAPVIEDPEKIRDAFFLLQRAELMFCDTLGAAPGADGVSDRPPYSFVFGMDDGTEFTYTFQGRTLVVEFPAPVGTYYYWLGDSIDDAMAFALSQ